MRRLLALLALLPFPLLAASPSDLPDLSVPPAGLARDGAQDVALIVAVEDYAFLPDVPGARANALAWEGYLSARGVFTKLLVDREVTRGEVLKQAAAVGAERGSGGKAWLVFIGHGAPGRDDHGSLVAMDAQQTTDSLLTYSVGQRELIDALGGGAGAPVVAVIDACFSGSSASGTLAPGSMPVRPVEVEVSASNTVLMAGKSTEYAGDLPGTGRPAFSWLVLGGLRGWADGDGDGLVTGTEVETWSRRQLLQVVTGRQQTPQLEGKAEVVLARGREADPGVVALVRKAAPVVVPGRTTGLGSDDDLLGDVDAIAAKLREAEALKQQLSEARERELTASVSRIQAQAKDTWSKLAPLRELGGPEAEAKVKAYVAKYGSVKAEYVDAEGTWTRAVAVAEVKEAEGWLARGSGGGATASGKDWTSPTVGLMKWIPGGTFTMGSPTSESGRDDDESQHSVTLTKGFLLMEHEVTQGEWASVMGSNPSRFTACGAICPVEQVSWLDAVGFANALSKKEGLTPVYTVSGESVTANWRSNGYRLPTEAEWEYAARGGQSYVYAGGSELDSVGWASSNSGSTTHPGCRKTRNGYGLCDMSGNVWEWVWDWKGSYGGSATDPAGPSAGSNRVSRGWGWYSDPEYARVADRFFNAPSYRGNNLGLRLARSLP